MGKKRVSIIEIDQGHREAMRVLLSDYGLEVFCYDSCVSARKDKEFLKSDLVITCFAMPFMNGIEFSEWIKNNIGSVKVVLMHSANDIFIGEAPEQGLIDGSLEKPFGSEKVKSILCEMEILTNEDGDRPDEYCRVPVSHFVKGFVIPFNIYTLVGREKYIKIAHEGEILPLDRALTYGKKNVDFFYLDREDFLSYINFQLTNRPRSQSKAKVSSEKVTVLLRIFQRQIFPLINFGGVDAELIERSKKSVLLVISDLVASEPIYDLFWLLLENESMAVETACRVAVLVGMVSSHLEMVTHQNRRNLILASLFYDLTNMLGDSDLDQVKNSELMVPKLLSRFGIMESSVSLIILHYKSLSISKKWWDQDDWMMAAHILGVCSRLSRYLETAGNKRKSLIELYYQLNADTGDIHNEVRRVLKEISWDSEAKSG